MLDIPDVVAIAFERCIRGKRIAGRSVSIQEE